MPLVISWICAVLLWIVKDAHPLPQILTLRTNRYPKFEDPDFEEHDFSNRDDEQAASHHSDSHLQRSPEIQAIPAEQLRSPPSRLEAQSTVGNSNKNSGQTYWVMQSGAILFRTTNRIEVADWIRIHGSRNLKVLATSEADI